MAGRRMRVLASVEALEPRKLLAGSLSAALPGDLTDKIDSRLWNAAHGGPRHRKNVLLGSHSARFDPAGRIQIYLQTSKKLTSLLPKLRSFGATVIKSSADTKLIQAFIPSNMLERVGRLPEVESVRLPDYGVPNTVTSAGDGLHKADQVRNRFAATGIDGMGIKVGVISDGATNRNLVGSELPPVTVDPDHSGSGNEGTAMLEIVHDLAPGAQLYFSGPSTSLDMPESIQYLVDQGCDVIVDDLSFFGESYFSDSTIALAAASAVNDGVVYVSSAGNYSNARHYQGSFVQGNAFSGGRMHRFSASPADDTNNITVSGGEAVNIALQWSDPWGGSGNNYDLYLTTTTGTVLQSSATLQNGNDYPFEFISWLNTSGSSRTVQIRIVKRSTAAVRELELFEYSNIASIPMQYHTPGDALIGQQAANGVMAVAAAAASFPTMIEDFSSQGGSTIYTDFTAQTKMVRQSLDGTAIDGVETSIGQQGYFVNPFFGTSAAAPHAAAIAALIRQAAPTFTPAEVLALMADTATDIAVPGYDTLSGAGLYNAADAIYKIYTPAAPDLATESDTGTSDSDNLTRIASPTFIGTVPANSYVRLFVDDVESAAVQVTGNDTMYELIPGSPLSDGGHTISIRVASSAAVALANNSNSSSDLTIEIDTVGPTLSTKSFNFETPIQNIALSFTQDVVVPLQNAALNLQNTTASSQIPVAEVTFSQAQPDELLFTFPGFPFSALPDGAYLGTLLATDITDAAGNALPENIELSFHCLGGDSNHDGRVDATDLGILAAAWCDQPGTFSQGDSTYDGTINAMDLLALALNWQRDLFTPSGPG